MFLLEFLSTRIATKSFHYPYNKKVRFQLVLATILKTLIKYLIHLIHIFHISIKGFNCLII